MAMRGKGALFGAGAAAGGADLMQMLLMQKLGLIGTQGTPPQQGQELPPERMVGPQRIPPVEAMGNTPMAPSPSRPRALADKDDPHGLDNFTPGVGLSGYGRRRRGFR